MANMKYSILFAALSVLAWQSTIAHPDPSLGLIGNIFDGLTGIGQDFIDGIRNGVSDGAKIAENFLEHVKNGALVIVHDTWRLGADIVDGVQDIAQQTVIAFTATIRAFADNLELTIQHVNNRVKRIALQNVLTTLERINSTAFELQQTIGHLGLIARTEVQLEIQHHVGEWRHWANLQLERVRTDTNNDEMKVSEAKTLLDELVERYTGYLISCSSEVEVNIERYNNAVQGTVAKYQTDAEKLLQIVQDCLDSDDSLRSSQQCKEKTRKQSRLLDSVPRDLLHLKQQGIELGERGFEGSICALNTLTQFELEKHNILRQLDDIMQEEDHDEDENENENEDENESEDEDENDVGDNSDSDAGDSNADVAGDNDGDSDGGSSASRDGDSGDINAGDSDDSDSDSGEGDTGINDAGDSDSNAGDNDSGDSDSDDSDSDAGEVDTDDSNSHSDE